MLWGDALQCQNPVRELTGRDLYVPIFLGSACNQLQCLSRDMQLV